MSDVVGSALIDIQPDFSQFGAKLTRGIDVAVKKAQKNAQMEIELVFNTSDMRSMNSGLGASNQQLEEIAKNTDRAATSLNKGFLGSFADFGAKTALFGASVSTFVKNFTAVADFGVRMSDAVVHFRKFSGEADHAREKVKLLGASLITSFGSPERQERSLRGMNRGVDGLADAVDRAMAKMGVASKKTSETVSDTMSKAAASAKVAGDKGGKGFVDAFNEKFAQIRDKINTTTKVEGTSSGGGGSSGLSGSTAGAEALNEELKEVQKNTDRAADSLNRGIFSKGGDFLGKTALFGSSVSTMLANSEAIGDFSKKAAEGWKSFREGNKTVDGVTGKVKTLGKEMTRAFAMKDKEKAVAKFEGIFDRIFKSVEKTSRQTKDSSGGFFKGVSNAASSIKDKIKGRIQPDDSGAINFSKLLGGGKVTKDATAAGGQAGAGFLSGMKAKFLDVRLFQFFATKNRLQRESEDAGRSAGKRLIKGFVENSAKSAATGLNAVFKRPEKLEDDASTLASRVAGRFSKALRNYWKFPRIGDAKQPGFIFQMLGISTGSLLKTGLVALGQLGVGMAKTARGTKQLFGAMNQFGKSLMIKSGASLIGALVVSFLALTVGMFKVTQMGLKAAAEMERLGIALKGVFQSTDKAAKETFDKINRFAALTPFSLQSASNAVIKLKSSFRQLSAGQAISVLKDIAGAAAAVGASEEAVNRATRALQQVGAKGVLAAEEMNQFSEALPNVSRTDVYAILAKKMKKSTDEIRRMQEQGKITAQDGVNALLQAAREAPGAATALANQANTFQGVMSTIKDESQKLLGITFMPLLQEITQVLKGAEGAFAKVKGPLESFVKDLIVMFKAFVPSIAPLIAAGIEFAAAFTPILSIFVQITSFTFKLANSFVFLLAKVTRIVSAGVFQTISKLLNDITGSVQNSLNWVVAMFQVIGSSFGAIGSFIGNAKDSIGNFFKNVGESFSLLKTLTDAVAESFKMVKGFFGADKGPGFLDGLLEKAPLVGGFFKAVNKKFKENKEESENLQDEIDGLGEGFIKLEPRIIDLEREMDNLLKTATGFNTVVGALGKGFADAFRDKDNLDAIKKFRDQFVELSDKMFEPLDPVVEYATAEKNLQGVRDNLAEVEKDISQLVKDRRELQKDVGRELREQEESLEAIAAIENRLRDLAQDREQLLHDEQRRLEEYQPTLAEMEDRASMANINLARAKRDVEAAQKAINDAVAAGMPKEDLQVDLAGLSLDQIRVRLAQVRATLAAQKAEKESVDTTEDKEILQENLLSSQISLRDTEREIVNLAQSKVDFIREQEIAQREFGERVIDLATEEKQLNRQKEDALKEHGKLLRGEIGVKKDIKDITEQINDAEKRRRDILKEVALAEAEVEIAAAKAEGNAQRLADAKKKFFDLQTAGLVIDQAVTEELQKQLDIYEKQRGSVNDLASLFQGLEQGKFVISATGLPEVDPTITGPERQRLQTLLNNLITKIPSLVALRQRIARLERQTGENLLTPRAEGGIFSSPTASLIGEAGREALLPLTRPGRMSELLASRSVWSPILSAMPKSALQSVRESDPDAINNARQGGGSAFVSRQEKQREMKMLADMIASSLKESGVGSSSVEVTAPVTIQTPGNSQVTERAIVRRIMKELDGRL